MELPMLTSACIKSLDPSGISKRNRSVPANAFFKNSINSAARGTMIYGAIVRYPPGRASACLIPSRESPGTGFAELAIDVLLSKSAFRRALKFSRGISRKSSAMRSSGARLRSKSFPSPARLPAGASMACTACSSWSIRERLAMCALQAFAQFLQCAELQLLYRSFRPAQLLRNLSNAPLLHEALVNHSPLLTGKLPDHPKQPGPRFQLFLLRFCAGFRVILPRRCLAGGPLRVIDHQVCGDANEPSRKRCAAPLERGQTGQCPVKHLGGQILGLVSLPHPPRDKRINTLKVKLIQISKF